MATSVAKLDLELRVRRSVADLSGLDLARLRRAFAEMMAVSDQRGYQHWAGIHGLPSPMYGRHADLAFLPWNRAYLAQFEEALNQFERGISLPWWDWTSEGAIPSAFAEPEVDGQPNPLYAAPIDSSRWSEAGAEHPSETSRDPGSPSRLPPAEMVEEALELTSFDAFSSQLENIHNSVHVWVGGTNSEIPYAFYDPFCWIYQTTIDRLWALWQRKNPRADEPPEGLAEQKMAPFDVSVEELWDPARLGYRYAEEGSEAVASGFISGAASDIPSTADELGRSLYARAFAEIIASDDTTPPLTIGIYGPWGIGKSSLLDMIEKQFEDPEAGPRPVHVVRFNAWEYNSSPVIWPALVRRVMEEMESHAQWSKAERLRETLRRNVGREWRRRRIPLAVGLASALVLGLAAAFTLDFNPTLIFAAVAALGVSGAVKLVSDAQNNPVSKWVATLLQRGDYGGELPYMEEIRADLEFLAAQMEKDGKKPRILVMIDDLDRCEPEKAVEVLQAVNQLLGFDDFIVCLGIDARIITAAVEVHYKDLLGEAGASGYEYLDKIVQIPFRIPDPTRDDVRTLLSAQMPTAPVVLETDAPAPSLSGGGASYGEREEDGTEESGEVERVEQRSEPEPESESEPLPPSTKFGQGEVEAFERLAPYIRSNPRHIKRLINVYRMVRTLAIIGRIDPIRENSSQTIAWIVICAQWPYAVSGMLGAFKPHADAVDDGGEYPKGEPLTFLHDACKGDLDEELQRKLDGDQEHLRELFERVDISWELLRSLERLTLNFNPAIEEALHRGAKAPMPPELAIAPSHSDGAGQPA